MRVVELDLKEFSDLYAKASVSSNQLMLKKFKMIAEKQYANSPTESQKHFVDVVEYLTEYVENNPLEFYLVFEHIGEYEFASILKNQS